jgi:hypothetical protein
VGRAGILARQLVQQGAVEHVLEPDADRQDVGHLLARQLDALLLGHLLPHRGAVERHDRRRQEELLGIDRGVPVDVHLRLVRALDRAAQQSLGDELAVERGGHGASLAFTFLF